MGDTRRARCLVGKSGWPADHSAKPQKSTLTQLPISANQIIRSAPSGSFDILGIFVSSFTTMFFMKSLPKACAQAHNNSEVMVFSTDEHPDGVVINKSAERPDCLHGQQDDRGFCLMCERYAPEKKVHDETDQEICKVLATYIDEDEPITENTSPVDTENDEERGEQDGDTDSYSHDDVGTESETETVDSDDEDDSEKEDEWEKVEIFSPQDIVVFWKDTDKRLANYFAGCVCDKIALGFCTGDQGIQYPAEDGHANQDTIIFLNDWNYTYEVPSEHAKDVFSMVLCYPDWRRKRLERFIQRELEGEGWEVARLLLDGDDLRTTLILKWNIANIPKK